MHYALNCTNIFKITEASYFCVVITCGFNQFKWPSTSSALCAFIIQKLFRHSEGLFRNYSDIRKDYSEFIQAFGRMIHKLFWHSEGWFRSYSDIGKYDSEIIQTFGRMIHKLFRHSEGWFRMYSYIRKDALNVISVVTQTYFCLLLSLWDLFRFKDIV
jgi:hypothetical protein